MTRDQFSEALDRYGGDLSRWPHSLAEDARVLVAGDAVAAAELSRAQRLDAVLADAVASDSVDAATIGRIVSHKRVKHSETILQPTRRLIGWASAAMVATMAMGFVIGVAVPADQSTDTIAALLFSGSESDIGGDLL